MHNSPIALGKSSFLCSCTAGVILLMQGFKTLHFFVKDEMEGVGGSGGGGHAETVARREKLSAWLAGAVAEDVARELNAARYSAL
jgi:hypothetical protein